jgi:hypothetical protein
MPSGPSRLAVEFPGYGGGDFLHAIEAAHERYFAERERLCDWLPKAVEPLPRSEALAIDMVADDWLRRRLCAMSPLRILAERLQHGPPVDSESELGRELRLIADDPQAFNDRLDAMLREGEEGDLGYALEMARVVVSLESGEQKKALSVLRELTGRSWASEIKILMERRKARPADAAGEAISVVWQLVYELAEKGIKGRPTRASDQRKALRGAIRNRLIDYIEEQQEGARSASVFLADESDPEVLRQGLEPFTAKPRETFAESQELRSRIDPRSPLNGLSIDDKILLKLLIAKAGPRDPTAAGGLHRSQRPRLLIPRLTARRRDDQISTFCRDRQHQHSRRMVTRGVQPFGMPGRGFRIMRNPARRKRGSVPK